MNKSTPGSRFVHVLLAVAVVVSLTALLGVRIAAGTAPTPERVEPTAPQVSPAISDGPRHASRIVSRTRVRLAPPATVPAPLPATSSGLEVPCWGCPGNRDWPVGFRTDLDRLAPLGDGPANAAEWHQDFTKPHGSRFDEWMEARERFTAYGGLENVLPPNDPLLREAEPWADQARMWFYPDFYAVEGYATRVPNLLLPLALAKSWVARGNTADDPADAFEDFRRAIRLGRLLRQEDAVVITDLVGLACIRYGAQGIYDLARDRGDLELALAASVVLGEYGPQRLMTSDRVTSSDITPYVNRLSGGRVKLDIPDSRVDYLFGRAVNDPNRRFRAEPIISIGVVAHLGTPEQRDKARELLDELTRSEDRITASLAVWCLDNEPDPEWLVPPPEAM